MLTSKQSSGFSLIELAMVIAVAAAMLLLSVKLFTNVQAERNLATTQQQLLTLYNAALKNPAQASKSCNTANICFGFPASMYTNPWQQGNSVQVIGSTITLITTLPNATVCANFKDRFNSLQSSSDVSTSSCGASSDNTTPSKATINIQMYQ